MIRIIRRYVRRDTRGAWMITEKDGKRFATPLQQWLIAHGSL